MLIRRIRTSCKLMLLLSGGVLLTLISHSQVPAKNNIWVNFQPGLGMTNGTVAAYINGGLNFARIKSIQGLKYKANVYGLRALYVNFRSDEPNETITSGAGGMALIGFDVGRRVQLRFNSGLAIIGITKDKYNGRNDIFTREVGGGVPIELGIHFMPSNFSGLGLSYFALLGKPFIMGAAFNLELGNIYGIRSEHPVNRSRVYDNNPPVIRSAELNQTADYARSDSTSMNNQRKGKVNLPDSLLSQKDAVSHRKMYAETKTVEKTKTGFYRGLFGFKIIGRTNEPILGFDIKFPVENIKVESIAGWSRRTVISYDPYTATYRQDFSFILLLEKNDNFSGSEIFNWVRGGGIAIIPNPFRNNQNSFCPTILGGIEFTAKKSPFNFSADAMLYWGSIIPLPGLSFSARYAFK